MPMPVAHPLSRRGVLAIAALGMVALLGCGRSDEIRSYDVKRETGETPVAPGTEKFRLLGVIIPVGPESWFVRFSGPIEEITPHEKAFDEFVASIRIPADGKQPTFTPPPGWKESPARQMRIATFVPPGEGKQPDLYVSAPFRGTLLMNVNRWRGDAGLNSVTEVDLPKVTTEVMLGTTKAYKVDFKGPGGKKKMGPFAGGS